MKPAFRTRPGAGGVIIGLLLAVMLSGCASRPQWPSAPLLDGATNLESRQLLEQVPFYPQQRYQCGPASLAMMLNAQGVSASPEELRKQVYLPGRQGSLQVELVAAARSHNLVVYPLETSLQALLSELAAGNPVLVMQNLRFDWWPQWHFAVVIGYDQANRNIILHTDTRERHEESVEVFMATWSRAGNWAVVMLPPDQLPATARPLDYLMAVNDLETTGHHQAAMQAYQRAELAWPEQPAAIMGQGNIAYQLADWPQAVQHFIRLTRRFPDLAAGWNNLAYALTRQGCQQEATVAAHCANQKNPERFSSEIQISGEAPSNHCPLITCPEGP